MNAATASVFALNGIYKFSKKTEVIPDVMVYDDGEMEENIGGVGYDMSKG